ncbi:LCP family protein [Nocardioides sp. Kera G14]|uniref:LCP family protein n=1 Tax=Nocardioides sp. Kera G14 TaxID=2884264 RepID=UPI001D109991|nr:LCP family protein [Nocardioides sp. Kera G14]UDY24697.1 LCP family protein [Nocardioides sp. Kera G14]
MSLRRLLVTTGLAGVLGTTLFVLPDSTAQPDSAVLVATNRARKVDIGKDMLYVLAVGTDARPGEDMLHARGDAIQMVSINTKTGASAIIGVPRDSWVDIPGHGFEKINAALYFGGPKLFAQTVGDLVGIQPDYVFLTRFEGLQAMVGTIGGVDIDNPFFFSDENLKKKGFQAGKIHLTGYEALAYSRIRHALLRGDFDRSRHQEVVMRAIQKKVFRKAASPGFLAKGVASVMKSLHTDLSPVELFKLGTLLATLDPAKVTNCVVQGGIGVSSGGASIVEPYVDQARSMGADAKKDGVLSKCESPWKVPDPASGAAN